MNAASADDTGVLAVPSGSTSLDPDLRLDITSAAWMMAVVSVPGLAVLALLV